MESSIFLTSPEIAERTILKNDLVFALLTNIPIVSGHTIVAPRRQVKTMFELASNEILAIVEMAERLRAPLRKSFGATGFNFAWNEASVAGQSVPHVHLHVIPRKEGDAGIWQYDPRKFIYRPGSREESPAAELKAVAEIIKKNLK